MEKIEKIKSQTKLELFFYEKTDVSPIRNKTIRKLHLLMLQLE